MLNFYGKLPKLLGDAIGAQGHVLDRSGPLWPTWNKPKKGSLSRKRPKEDERVGRAHCHERVDESPARCGHFGANGSKISHFVPKIRPFEEKSACINNSVHSKSWLLFIIIINVIAKVCFVQFL